MGLASRSSVLSRKNRIYYRQLPYTENSPVPVGILLEAVGRSVAAASQCYLHQVEPWQAPYPIADRCLRYGSEYGDSCRPRGRVIPGSASPQAGLAPEPAEMHSLGQRDRDQTQPVGFGKPATLQAPFAGPDGKSS